MEYTCIFVTLFFCVETLLLSVGCVRPVLLVLPSTGTNRPIIQGPEPLVHAGEMSAVLVSDTIQLVHGTIAFD